MESSYLDRVFELLDIDPPPKNWDVKRFWSVGDVNQNLKVKKFWFCKYRFERDLQLQGGFKVRGCRVSISKTEKLLADVFLNVQSERVKKR